MVHSDSKKQYTPTDPHIPKFRWKRFDILNNSNKDFYAAMKQQYPELDKYSNKDISKIIEHYNKRLAQEVINNRNGLKLPDGLGIVVAGACRISRKSAAENIDFKTSDELGQTVIHQNLHSDEYIAKIKYSNELDRHMFDNHHLWFFDACRPLTRTVAAEFKNGNHKNYIVFTTRQHISHLFRKQKIEKVSTWSQRKKEKRLEEHDEFAI